MRKLFLTGIAALFLATGVAHATEDNPILMILACRGTVITTSPGKNDDAKPEPVSMGIIVRKTTVHGFDSVEPFFGEKREPAKIRAVSETVIAFGKDALFDGGIIDRVTGDVSVSFPFYGSMPREGIPLSVTTYDLKCMPTRRMF
jgi:hypothetical protein